jgi:hypothetical protein
LKAVYRIVLSSVETMGAFNTGFDTVNLHRPTEAVNFIIPPLPQPMYHGVAAQVEIENTF